MSEGPPSPHPPPHSDLLTLDYNMLPPRRSPRPSCRSPRQADHAATAPHNQAASLSLVLPLLTHVVAATDVLIANAEMSGVRCRCKNQTLTSWQSKGEPTSRLPELLTVNRCRLNNPGRRLHANRGHCNKQRSINTQKSGLLGAKPRRTRAVSPALREKALVANQGHFS